MRLPTGFEGLRAPAVYCGGERGGAGERDRPGRPTQREQHDQHGNNSPTRDAAHRARNQGSGPTTTQPNLNDQREPQPRPQVEDRPNQNTTRKTSHPQDRPTPSEKNCSPPDTHQQTACTTQQRDDPNQDPQPTKQVGAGVKEGSEGNSPHTSHHPAASRPGPTRQTPPPTRHPQPETQPRPETRQQNQNPHHPPTTPPPTPHQVPCTHAMGHIQPTPTLANKLEQTPQTSSRKSKLQMPRPRPSSHPTAYQYRRTEGGVPVAPPGMRHARNRRRPHRRRRQP